MNISLFSQTVGINLHMKNLLSFSLIASTLIAFMVSPVQAKKGDGFASKGKITVFGALDFDSTTETPFGKDGKAFEDQARSTTTITFAPRIGYFIIKGLEIAVDFSYSSTTSKDNDGKETLSSSKIIPGLDVAYYITQTKALKKMGLLPYAHLGLGYGMESTKPTEGDSIDSSGMKLTPGIGMAWRFGKGKGGVIKVGLDYQLLTQANDKTKDGIDLSSIRLATSFGVFF